MTKEQQLEIQALIVVALEESKKATSKEDYITADFYASEARELMKCLGTGNEARVLH